MEPVTPGTAVMVRNLFDGSWCSGFEIHEVDKSRVVVRRVSDGSVLRPIPLTEVRVQDQAHYQPRLTW